jgi:nucleotide-binding universal stress UspA family protein
MRPGEWAHPVVDELRKIVDDAGVPGERVQCDIESGDPARVIVARALAMQADTIVLGTGARHDRERLLVGPVTDVVVRRAPCDVLTVPPRSAWTPRNGHAPTIVCGVDFSTSSIDGLRASLGLADQIEARVVLVHAVESLPDVAAADAVDFDVSDFRTRLVCNAQRQLDALIADESPFDRVIRTKVAIGRSHGEVLRIAAAERADLIVLGHRGRDAGPVPLLGATVERIVRAAACPVLTIRSPHQRLPHRAPSIAARPDVV